MRWLGGFRCVRCTCYAPLLQTGFKPAKGAPLSAEAQAELNARYAEQLAANVAKAEKIDLLADTLRKKWGLTAPIKKS